MTQLLTTLAQIWNVYLGDLQRGVPPCSYPGDIQGWLLLFVARELFPGCGGPAWFRLGQLRLFSISPWLRRGELRQIAGHYVSSRGLSDLKIMRYHGGFAQHDGR